MHNHANAGILCTDVVNVLGQKALVDGAVALPENYFGGAQAVGSYTSAQLIRVPHDHFV